MSLPSEEPVDSSPERSATNEVEVDFTKDPLSDKIGSSLRRMYDDVVNEDIPDDFLSILKKADNQT